MSLRLCADISLASSSFDVISSLLSFDKLACPFLSAPITYLQPDKEIPSVLLTIAFRSELRVCVCMCVGIYRYLLGGGMHVEAVYRSRRK